MDKEKIRRILNILIIGVATTALILVSYMLSYICFNLCNSGCKEAFVGMIVGITLTGTIICLFYLILVIWKEIR